VLTCECSETCILAMHVVSQDDLISIAQFDLDQNQNISSPQTDCNSLLSLCPCIKQKNSAAVSHNLKRKLAWHPQACLVTGACSVSGLKLCDSERSVWSWKQRAAEPRKMSAAHACACTIARYCENSSDYCTIESCLSRV
jgi:hypothetical protein